MKSRIIVFQLAATSIWCLLAEMYGLCPMRLFTGLVFGPSLVALTILTIWHARRGDRELAREIVIGALAGFVATIGYDVFRLPFVFARQWGLASVLPALPLFKVFPEFGRMILGQTSVTPAAHVVGWLYHFSNGVSFGVMYAALVGGRFRSGWPVAILMAVGLELAMLFTPYPQLFQIQIGVAFVTVTLAAHLIFGVTMGWSGRWWVLRNGGATTR